MSKRYLLGVDIGTYESKGVITTVDGKIVNSQVKPHQMIIPQQGWAEHDAEDVWWGDFVDITRRLLEVTGINPTDIAAIACSAIAPDILPVDAECRPLRPGGILYGVDTRAAAEIAEFVAGLESDERRVLELMIEGCGEREIAQRTGSTRHGVRALRQRIRVLASESFGPP